MASVFRRWRVFLVLNVVVVAGFMTFWARCNTGSVKSTGLNQAGEGRRMRTNSTNQVSSISQEGLLRRLGSLEDVVYRQLNGLSRSLGLIEGVGGRGRGGLPATLTPAEQGSAKVLREKYGYNAFLSDRISLDRTLPDYRPSKCKEAVYPRSLPSISLIFILVNEALSVVLRSVHSAVSHTPAHLLKEIILVDDHSDHEQLKGPLEEYVRRRYPGLVKLVRTRKREGLIRARIQGWKAASGEVTGFFDAHVEFTPAWAEPVLSRIQGDPRRIVLPSIDNIKHESFELERYENSAHGFNWELWCMYISPPRQWWDQGDTSAPIRTPAMIGCSFVADRAFFGELGLLDAGMDVYGGENIELGIRVWLCGGSMEVLPCSRVAHMARSRKPYLSNLALHTRRNALRVAEVWMDKYKSAVYMAWNIPMRDHGIDIGDISQRRELRSRLQCKSFEWYLDNIYPEMRRYNNTLYYGEVRNDNASHLCLDQGEKDNHTAILHPCHGLTPQLGRYVQTGQLFLGSLGSTGEDTRCVMDDEVSGAPQLVSCEALSGGGGTVSRGTAWIFSQNEPLVNRHTGRCLEVVKSNVYFGFQLVLQTCSGQRWTIKNIVTQDRDGP